MEISKTAVLPTRIGEFKVCAIKDRNKDHILIFKGDLMEKENVPFRIHSECLTSEVLGSLKCDCKEQLDTALQYIQDEGLGALLYLRQEGRGIGLFNKVEAYALQDIGYDTIEANEKLGFPVDGREYSIAAEVLRSFGILSVKLLTNNPLKIESLQQSGIKITEIIRLTSEPNVYNSGYLEVKKLRMNHYF